MIFYSFVFAYIMVLANIDNIEIGYNILIIRWCIIFDTIVVTGNFVYAFNYTNGKIKKIWRFVFPILILHFSLMLYLDSTIPEDVQGETTLLIIISTFFAVLTFLPTFWAHYKLAYLSNSIKFDN